MGGISGSPVQPVQFQKAMVFIDGTNLIYRLQDAKLRLNKSLPQIVGEYLGGRQIVRIYLYTIQEHLDAAKGAHGDQFTAGVRVVLGEGIRTSDGNIREKGVDALLVADLVYHAAVKNYDYALLVSADTDFVQALSRVEDFGCRTGVLTICTSVPARLREVCDEAYSLSSGSLKNNGQAVPV